MVNDPRLRNQLRSDLHESVQLIISAQNNDGGWRYQPRPGRRPAGDDLPDHGPRAARNAGIAVPKTVADKLHPLRQGCQDLHNTGGFPTKARRRSGFARTAAGVVALTAPASTTANRRQGPQVLRQYKPGNAGAAFLATSNSRCIFLRPLLCRAGDVDPRRRVLA